jgi:signal transduction histidine kinase
MLLAEPSYFLFSAAIFLLAVVLIINYRADKKRKKYLSDLEKRYEECQNELIQVRQKAEESDRLKSSFLANMSHEIRTPLNAIMGFSSLLQSADEKSETDEYIEIINKNCHKLLDMMDEIFNIALIESGITQMYKENCQVNELLTSLVTHFNIEKESSDKESVMIKTKKLASDKSFSVYTDPRKLRQTLFNLIENALKYTNEGYVEIGYNLTENSMIEFYVKDTGLGFPKEKLDVIFQRFRQVDDSNTRNFGGIGLGLALSQKFVEMMGGSMYAESSPGNGSIFYFTIPVTEVVNS